MCRKAESGHGAVGSVYPQESGRRKDFDRGGIGVQHCGCAGLEGENRRPHFMRRKRNGSARADSCLRRAFSCGGQF